MKRKILALSGLAIFAAMLAWGTLAYFTAEDRAINVLTIGSVDIRIDEYDEAGNRITPDAPPESFRNIEPGDDITKQVIIKNQGKNMAWIRAKIIDTITSTEGNLLDEDVLTYNVNNLKNGNAQTATGVWTLNEEDGYYYFDMPVALGQAAVLFDAVSFDGDRMDNDYQGCETKIQVIAQAVQYEGNENRDPESWPAEPEKVSPDSEFYVHIEETGGEQT